MTIDEDTEKTTNIFSIDMPNNANVHVIIFVINPRNMAPYSAFDTMFCDLNSIQTL